MRLRGKVVALIVMWVAIGWAAVFAVPVWWGRLVLLAIASGVTLHLLWLKTLKTDGQAPRVQQRTRARATSRAE